LSEARRLAAVVAGLGVVSAAVFWGHPEDCIALALVPWAALAVDRDGRHGLRRAAWLLGVAVACQPLALLAVAPVVARFGWRDLRGAVLPLALPTVVVVLPEVVASKARKLHAVVDQPYLPAGESSTPFGHFARALGHGMYSGGTLRLVATVAAVSMGCALCRRRHDLPTVLFAMSLAFTLRVARERASGLLLLPGGRSLAPAHLARTELVTVRGVRDPVGALPRPREPPRPRRRPVVAGHHGDDARHDGAGARRLPTPPGDPLGRGR